MFCPNTKSEVANDMWELNDLVHYNGKCVDCIE